MCLWRTEVARNVEQNQAVKDCTAAAHAVATVVAGQIAGALGGGGGRHGEVSAAAEHLATADSLCALAAYLSGPAAAAFAPDGHHVPSSLQVCYLSLERTIVCEHNGTIDVVSHTLISYNLQFKYTDKCTVICLSKWGSLGNRQPEVSCLSKPPTQKKGFQDLNPFLPFLHLKVFALCGVSLGWYECVTPCAHRLDGNQV